MGSEFSAEVKLNQEVFYPGNLVTGHVAIKVQEPGMKCIGARICCRGEETCYALRSSDIINPITKLTTFLDETLTLFGPSKTNEGFTTVEISHGTYAYPFEFRLPLHIPGSTSVSTFGNGGVKIAYHVDAVIQLHAEEFKNFQHTFQVVTPVNAEELKPSSQKIAAPQGKGTAKLSTFFQEKGTADFSVQLDRGLYCGGGDKITGTLEIDNSNGEIPVENVQVHLQCRVESKVRDVDEKDKPMDCFGSSWVDPIINHKLANVNVLPGAKGTIQLSESLPETVHYASYPSTGEHYKIKHVLTLTVENGNKPHNTVELPIIIAHSADPKNSQQFMPPLDVATQPHTITEFAYDPSLHEKAHIIRGVTPDSSIPLEKKVSAEKITAASPGLAPQSLKSFS